MIPAVEVIIEAIVLRLDGVRGPGATWRLGPGGRTPLEKQPPRSPGGQAAGAARGTRDGAVGWERGKRERWLPAAPGPNERIARCPEALWSLFLAGIEPCDSGVLVSDRDWEIGRKPSLPQQGPEGKGSKNEQWR